MAKLYPFLSYYGSKWRAAKRYPTPTQSLIVEPFAGGAGYACNYPDRKVILCERDPRLAAIWKFLIASSKDDILALPLLGLDASAADLPALPEGGRELIRSWLQGGSRNAKNTFSSMARSNLERNPNTPSFWGAACRDRIAQQVDHIKHWEVLEGDYTGCPNVQASWFIDPPYDNAAGRVYRYHALNYAALGSWCMGRPGQVIVCENEGATWLPFEPVYQTANNWNAKKTKRSVEVMWYRPADAV